MLFLLKQTGLGWETQAEQMGVPESDIGQLISPADGHANAGRPFALDNGCFSGFDTDAFLRLLDKHKAFRERCLYVVVPDVPMSARRTLETWDYWHCRLPGWPLAFACQNGQEDLPIPWEHVTAVFLGGDDRWKVSEHARAIVRAAKCLGKWAHMGRVNGPCRLAVAEEWGVDSIDGTGLSLYPKARKAVRDYNANTPLDFAEEA